jgi:hypothetical protein
MVGRENKLYIELDMILLLLKVNDSVSITVDSSGLKVHKASG